MISQRTWSAPGPLDRLALAALTVVSLCSEPVEVASCFWQEKSVNRMAVDVAMRSFSVFMFCSSFFRLMVFGSLLGKQIRIALFG
jgi:hypothetical protein